MVETYGTHAISGLRATQILDLLTVDSQASEIVSSYFKKLVMLFAAVVRDGTNDVVGP